MNILALDIASIVGACDGEPGGVPRLFTWYLRDAGETRPQRLLALDRLLRAYFGENPCDGVVYEAPLPLGVLHSIGAQEATLAFTRGAIGVVELACAAYGKKVQGLAIQSARLAVLGWALNRRSSGLTTKMRVSRDVRMLGIEPENDNEADAFVIWSYACAKTNPRVALLTTPLFQARL